MQADFNFSTELACRFRDGSRTADRACRPVECSEYVAIMIRNFVALEQFKLPSDISFCFFVLAGPPIRHPDVHNRCQNAVMSVSMLNAS